MSYSENRLNQVITQSLKRSSVVIRLNSGLLVNKRSYSYTWNSNEYKNEHSGISDALVISENGNTYFLEYKSETGRLEPMQKAFRDALRACNQDVLVVTDKNVFSTIEMIKGDLCTRL